MRFIRWGAKLLTVLLARMEVHDIENLPDSGSYIAVSNHLGRIEIVLVYSLLNRDDIILMIAEKYRKSIFWRVLARLVDGVFIDRFNPDIAAMRTIFKKLKQGGVLVIAPEGTRSKSEVLLEGHSGAAYIAAKAGVPIVPVGVTGSEDRLVLQNLKRLKRSHVILHIGKPFTLPQLHGHSREAQLKQDTDEIMCQIAALLPESYHGYYKGYPRIYELTQSTLNSSIND